MKKNFAALVAVVGLAITTVACSPAAEEAPAEAVEEGAEMAAEGADMAAEGDAMAAEGEDMAAEGGRKMAEDRRPTKCRKNLLPAPNKLSGLPAPGANNTPGNGQSGRQ